MPDQTSQSVKDSQKELLETIESLLLSAGYYRVLINGLSPFDRVVGGLCWCIISSGEIVDVDILFQENSSIGEKIALSEAIVNALKLMKCPHDLQPHQIQGGVGGIDFKYILPVLTWLIKKFSSRRKEINMQLRNYSLLYGIKHCPIRDRDEHTILLENILSSKIVSRKFKRKSTKGESEEMRVHSCLLEYGDAGLGQFGINDDNMVRVDVGSGDSKVELDHLSKMNTSELSAFERQLQQASRNAAEEEAAFKERSKEEEEALMKQMEAQRNDGSIVSASAAGGLVGLGADEIGSAAAAYEAEMGDAKRLLSSMDSIAGQASIHKQQVSQIQNQLHQVLSQVNEQAKKKDMAFKKSSEAEEERQKNENIIKTLNKKLKELTNTENKYGDQASLTALKAAILANERLKTQESNFKIQCKSDRQSMQEELAQLNEQNEMSKEGQMLKQVQDSYNKGSAKYARIKKVLADTYLSVATNRRSIDDVPTRSELIQYERRFGELYDQTAQRLVDTRKYYTLYNSLNSKLEFLQKEMKLLNSISENFEPAMRDPASRVEFLGQCGDIVSGVDSSLEMQQKLLAESERESAQLKERHLGLVQKQRAYYKAIKDFQQECDKNEWLEQQLQKLNNSS